MRNGNVEQQTVAKVAARVPGTARVLRSYGIDPTSRVTFTTAALAAGETPDALLAVLEDRARRAARARRERELVVEM